MAQNLKILLVDDDSDSLKSLNRALNLHGYNTTSCYDPLEAIEIMNKKSYDILATDFRMPCMTGLELVKEVKKKNPEIFVIMFSGYMDKNTLKSINIKEIDTFFSKPINIEQFLNVLSKVLLRKKNFKNFNETFKVTNERL